MSKRYLQWGYDSFKDTKTGEISDDHIHILNKQAERIAELEAKLAESEENNKLLEMQLQDMERSKLSWENQYFTLYNTLKNYREVTEKKHLLDEKEWQDYCAFKHIEPQIKGCLDREREYEKQLAEKDKAIENRQTMCESVVQTCKNDKEEIERLNKQLETQENTITNLVEDNRASQEWYKKQIAELEEQLENVIVPKFKIGQEVFYIAPKRQIVKASVIGCFEDGLIVQCKNRSFIKLLNENVFVCEEDAKIGIEKYYKSIHKNYNRNKLNNVYRKMKDRCYNPKSLSYINYGAIGITVCDEWKNSYNKFKAWAENNGYEEDIMPNGRNRLTLDRIDNTKGYCPSNCRWVTQKDQQNNRRNNRNIKLEELKGE